MKRKRALRRAVAAAVAAAFVAAILVIDLFVCPFSLLSARAGAPDIPPRGENELRIHFLDVGQGDCTVIEFPGGESMLVDGGDGSASHVRAAVGYCLALGIDIFDRMLLTHPDEDHAGGLAELLRTFGAEKIYLPFRSAAEGEEKYAEFIAGAEASGAELLHAQTLLPLLPEGETGSCFGLFLSPFSPEIRPLPEEDNDASAVLYLEYAGRRLLMTGDASAAVEEEIADAWMLSGGAAFACPLPSGRLLVPDLAALDFLKAGHHGSSASTGTELAALCAPKQLFISCGAGNSYGHPGLTAMENVLAQVPDAGIWRTDELGNIMLTVRADGSYDIRAVG